MKKVQAALIELGYDISTANGKYGPSTTKAISAFYKDLGDSDDGTSLGKIGWTKVFEALDEQRADEKIAEQVAAQPVAVDPALAAVIAATSGATKRRRTSGAISPTAASNSFCSSEIQMWPAFKALDSI